jgi:hypothetical protein
VSRIGRAHLATIFASIRDLGPSLPGRRVVSVGVAAEVYFFQYLPRGSRSSARTEPFLVASISRMLRTRGTSSPCCRSSLRVAAPTPLTRSWDLVELKVDL